MIRSPASEKQATTGLSATGWSAVFPPSVEQMADGQDRVPQEHSWTGESHDLLNAFSHLGLVAVDRALGAGALLWPEGAAVEAAGGVVEQFGALWAQGAARSMVFLTVEPQHGRHGSLLACNSWRVGGHGVGTCLSRRSGFSRASPSVSLLWNTPILRLRVVRSTGRPMVRPAPI